MQLTRSFFLQYFTANENQKHFPYFDQPTDSQELNNIFDVDNSIVIAINSETLLCFFFQADRDKNNFNEIFSDAFSIDLSFILMKNLPIKVLINTGSMFILFLNQIFHRPQTLTISYCMLQQHKYRNEIFRRTLNQSTRF